MSRWDTVRHEQRFAEISGELGRLLRAQSDFFSKGPKHSAQELREFAASCKRARELFDELEALRRVA